jgi:plasmid maintenance system antidote protein VapI
VAQEAGAAAAEEEEEEVAGADKINSNRYFGMSDRFWINLESRYDIEMEKDLLADRLDRDVRPRAAAG